MPCVVCIVHMETGSTDFLVERQNQGRRVSRFGPQSLQLQFGNLDLKIIAMVSLFVPQNQAGYGLLAASQSRREDEDGVGYESRSSGLLRLEASQARVSQSGLKTGGGTAQMVHMTSS
jgi:hypothetical protein